MYTADFIDSISVDLLKASVLLQYASQRYIEAKDAAYKRADEVGGGIRGALRDERYNHLSKRAQAYDKVVARLQMRLWIAANRDLQRYRELVGVGMARPRKNLPKPNHLTWEGAFAIF